MKAADYLLDIFAKEEIKNIFMVPGGYVDPFVSSLQKFPSLQAIVAAHEGGAVFMADGYARVGGKFGVALGLGGPGITNMVTGITSAYMDQTPLFIITGETKTPWEGRGAFQDTSTGEINDTVLLQSITTKKLNLTHVQQLEHHMNHLLSTMLNHAQRGPVHLSFPADLQQEEVNLNYHKLSESTYQPRFLNQHSFKQIWQHLVDNSNIAILAGTGVLHANASETLIKFAERFEIPVATTLTAKGVFPEDHRLSLGVFGWFGNKRAIATLLAKNIDVLIVLGSRLNQMDTMVWTQDLLPRKALIINDINEANYYNNYTPDLFVLGDNKEFLQAFLEAKNEEQLILEKTKPKRQEWLTKEVFSIGKYYDEENLSSDKMPIHPARLVNDLRAVMPKNTILFLGEGAHGFFASHYWTSYQPREFFTPVKYVSAMGWSIPAAIGGKLAQPDKPVVCLTGDGSIMMHGMEIQTAARYQLPIIFIVSNNQAHGNPQLRGRRVGAYEEEFLALPLRDWAKFGESLGAVGLKVEKPEELCSTFQRALELKTTVVIDVATGNYPTPTYVFDEYMYHVKADKG